MLESEYFLGEGKFTKRGPAIMGLIDRIRSTNDVPHYPEAVSSFIYDELESNTSNKGEEFRHRTAEDIVQSGYFNGCVDRGLVFTATTRGLGIPTRYVEAFFKPWLNFLPTEEQIEKGQRLYYDVMDEFGPIYEKCNGAEDRAICDKLLYKRWLDETGDETVPVEQIQTLVMFRNLTSVQMHTFADVLMNGQWKKYDVKRGFLPNDDYTICGLEHVVIGKGLDFSKMYIRGEDGEYESKPTDIQYLAETIGRFRAGSSAPDNFFKPSFIERLRSKIGF